MRQPNSASAHWLKGEVVLASLGQHKVWERWGGRAGRWQKGVFWSECGQRVGEDGREESRRQSKEPTLMSDLDYAF